MKYEAKALTIAGSDSGGGAGIQADLKTFQSFNVFGTSAITSITAQNTTGVRSVKDIELKIVGDQIDMIMEDMGCDAAKTGMVSNTEIISIIAEKVNEHKIQKLVVDPVMVAKSGARLLQKKAEKALIENLLPLAYLLTPNIPEAELISGISIENESDMKNAAQKIYDMGAKNVLVKGGHLNANKITDLLFDGANFFEFKSERIETKSTHGTGCTLSSAIAASLAKNISLNESVKIAIDYINRSIKSAPGIGKGFGPLNHLTKPKDISEIE